MLGQVQVITVCHMACGMGSRLILVSKIDFIAFFHTGTRIPSSADFYRGEQSVSVIDNDSTTKNLFSN